MECAVASIYKPTRKTNRKEIAMGLNKQLIYIIGMPAAGKSTFGRKLAQALNWSFVDLDIEIESQEQSTIAKIWQEKGEEEFRKLEQRELYKTQTLTHTIISVGGGAPCFENNLLQMKSWGLVVFLNTGMPKIAERIQNMSAERPMFIGKNTEEIHKTLEIIVENRSNCYSAAHIVWNTEEVTEWLESALVKLLELQSQWKMQLH